MTSNSNRIDKKKNTERQKLERQKFFLKEQVDNVDLYKSLLNKVMTTHTKNT